MNNNIPSAASSVTDVLKKNAQDLEILRAINKRFPKAAKIPLETSRTEWVAEAVEEAKDAKLHLYSVPVMGRGSCFHVRKYVTIRGIKVYSPVYKKIDDWKLAQYLSFDLKQFQLKAILNKVLKE